MKKHIDMRKFCDARHYLAATYQAKRESNPRFNLSVWARQLGLKSQGYLSNVMNGHRPISSGLTAKFSTHLGLGPADHAYFSLLVDFSQEKNPGKKEGYAGLLKRVNPDFRAASFDLDQFKCVHEWHHIAISEMIKLKGFREDGDAMSAALGRRLTPRQCEEALERLKRLKLVKYDESGRLVSNRDAPLFIGDGRPNEYLRFHHGQFIDLAKEALLLEEFGKRDVRGTTFAIKAENMPALVRLITEFHENLHRLAVQTHGDAVVRVNTQAFSLTNEMRNDP